mmetsp:Transcript_23336/g.28760  ORF Transcript_23336/g.28760 Transcript_23336/m.28760 type:complete len:117 (-) Transcript_23336:315-665(-)
MFNDLALHWREYQQMDKLNFREITPDDMCVVLYRDIWERFHDSYVYKNLSARCKREYSRKYVLEHLKQNLTLREFYREREQRRGILENFSETYLIRNVFLCFKLIPEAAFPSRRFD